MKEPTLTSYRYSGPQSGVTLRQKDGTEKEVLLHNGAEVSLPADHPWVKKAVLKGYLTKLDQTSEVSETSEVSFAPAAKPVKSGKEAPNAG